MKNFLKKTRRIIFKLFLLLLLIVSVVIFYLRFIPITTSAFIIKQNSLADNSPELYLPARQQWVDFDNISQYLKLAAIAAEDQLFLSHYGFDFKQIQYAIQHYNSGKKLRGASTITQQMIKNLFLWSNGDKQKRKVIEAAIVPFIELWWSKKRILEVYLNIAQFGDVTYGVELASQEFFHKSAKELNKSEAALLIAVLPSPSRYSIKNKSKQLIERQQWIINRMNNIYQIEQIQQFVDK